MKRHGKNPKETAPTAATAASGAHAPSPDPENEPFVPAPHQGWSRVHLLLLAAAVLLVNLPFLTGRCMVAHDTRFMLGIFDYFYSNALFAGELPRWMVYGLYGLDASVFHISFMTPGTYLAIGLGKLLGIHDSLGLFAVAVCFEQWLLLLGLYLLCCRIFRDRLAVFCVCLTVLGTMMWQSQISLNLRLFYLLPLEFYFLLRLRQDGKGYFGWLACALPILGPLGSAPYFYPLWALILTIFSLALFGGRFRRLLAMIRPSPANIAAALLFAATAATFAGTLWKALDNVAFIGPNRQGDSGHVPLTSFLTYGGNDLGDMWSSLLDPGAYIKDTSGRMGMTDYIGLLGLFCLPFGWRTLLGPRGRSFAITTLALFALSRGGVLASIAYFFPGMNMYRHIGFLTGVLKLLLLILAGFGFDQLLQSVREGTLLRQMNWKLALGALIAVLLYLDLNIGGAEWARVISSLQQGAPKSPLPMVEPICAVLRAVLLLGVVWALWRTYGPAKAPARRSPLLLGFLVITVVGDCVLFQAGAWGLLPISSQRYAFRVVKPTCSLVRSDQIPNAMVPKLKVWTNAPGAEYQIGISSALQWDPPVPRCRADWAPKNFLKMRQILERGNPADRSAICGENRSKFRLLTQADHVETDAAALALLESKPGWETRLILTDPGHTAETSPPAPAAPDFGAAITDFSANNLSLTISNPVPASAWFVYADAFAPGWHARVNGKPVAVLPAYGAFKAVPVEPGNNQIAFHYDNGARTLALRLFSLIAGLAALVGLGFLGGIAVKDLFAPGFRRAVPDRTVPREQTARAV